MFCPSTSGENMGICLPTSLAVVENRDVRLAEFSCIVMEIVDGSVRAALGRFASVDIVPGQNHGLGSAGPPSNSCRIAASVTWLQGMA